MCLHPRLIANPKYKANKKNGGVVPPFSDKRVLMTPVGCGDCIECRKKKSREVQIRLYEEIKGLPENIESIFITLTFSTEEYVKLLKECKNESGLEGYDLDNQVAGLAIRRFTERWRKQYKKAIRHWLITELGHGLTEHIHIHGLLWVDKKEIEKQLQRGDTKKDATERLIDKYWKYGRVGAGKYVNRKTINYISKYITKMDAMHKCYKPRIYASKGIGANYLKGVNANLNKYKKNGETREYYTTETGHKIALPTYYRNKIYNDTEREKLWINKLDEEKRYVMKVEIDISKGEEEYYKALKIAQENNRILGYGTGENDKARIKYEKIRRKYLQNKRAEQAGIKLEEKVVYGGGEEEQEADAIHELRQKLGEGFSYE